MLTIQNSEFNTKPQISFKSRRFGNVFPIRKEAPLWQDMFTKKYPEWLGPLPKTRLGQLKASVIGSVQFLRAIFNGDLRKISKRRFWF